MAPHLHESLALSVKSFGLGVGLTWLLQRWFLWRRIQIRDSPRSNTQRDPPASAKFMHPPHRSWTPGQPQPPPFEMANEAAMVSIDPMVTEKAYMYSLMISAVTPRPIGFVTSMSRDGVVNLAPYSYFNMASPHVRCGIWEHVVNLNGSKCRIFILFS